MVNRRVSSWAYVALVLPCKYQSYYDVEVSSNNRPKTMAMAPTEKEAYTVSKMLQSINDVMAPVVVESSSSPHASVALKRRMDNGVMLDTRPQEIALLDLQAKVKHAAHQVASLASRGERLAWVRDRRLRANAVFEQGRFQQAAELYVEALTALDFGDSPQQRRDCELHVQLPLTCNLVACLLRMEQWHKALRVSEQALSVMPGHVRALSQRAKALMKLGRMDDARYDLQKAIQQHDRDDRSDKGGSTSDQLLQLRRQLADVERATQRERQRSHQQRRFQRHMMHEAVGRLYEDKPVVQPADAASRDDGWAVVQQGTLSQRLVRWLASMLLVVLQFLFGKLDRHE